MCQPALQASLHMPHQGPPSSSASSDTKDSQLTQVAALSEHLLKAEKLATKVWMESQEKKGGGFFKKCMQGLEEVLREAAICKDTLRILLKFRKTADGVPLTEEYVTEKLSAGQELLSSLQEQTAVLRALAPKA